MFNGKERRKYKRPGKPYYMVRLRIKHHEGLKTSSDGWDWVVLKDLSAGGAIFSYNKNLEIGTLLNLQINVSKPTPTINCVGRVTRIEQSQLHSTLQVAIEFEDIDEQTKELINKIAEEIIEQKAGFENVNESRKESRMANLTSDAEIKGTIKFGEAMRMDGNFEGELISDNGELVVGKTGNVKANVNVKSAVIEGRVDGNIKASDKVELKQNAHLTGDLQAKTLVVEKGVVLVGQCNINPEGTKIESQKSYKKKKSNRLSKV